MPGAAIGPTAADPSLRCSRSTRSRHTCSRSTRSRHTCSRHVGGDVLGARDLDAHISPALTRSVEDIVGGAMTAALGPLVSMVTEDLNVAAMIIKLSAG